MKKTLSLICCLFFFNAFNFAQQTSAPVIISKIPADKKEPTKLPDLEGLAGKPAPVFKASNMNDEEFNLENLRGKVIVINLWGTFCEPCVQEMPKLNALVEKYEDKPVVFLAPAVDAKEALNNFLQKHPFSYQVLPDSFGIVSQYSPKKKGGAETKPGSFIMLLPTHLIIDKDGTVFKHFWGFSEKTDAEISTAIDELLSAKTK